MTMDSLDGLGLPDPWEVFEQDTFVPNVEPRLGPEPDAAMLEAVEGSVEDDVAPAQERFAPDSSGRILDLAETGIESPQKDRVWPLSDSMLDLVEQDCENRVIRAAMLETEVKPAEDRGWFGPTPNTGADRPPAAGREETFDGPWRLPIGVRPTRTRIVNTQDET